MRVIIYKQICKAKIDLNRFKQALRKNFNLMDAVSKTLEITSVREGVRLSRETVVAAAYHNLDWKFVFDCLEAHDEMLLQIHPVEIDSLTNYAPLTMDSKKGVLYYGETNEKVDDLMVVHNLGTDLSAHVEALLSSLVCINPGLEDEQTTK